MSPNTPAAFVGGNTPAAPALCLLGVPQLQHPGGVVRFGNERRFQLLARLALAAGAWVPRADVAQLLWPGHDPVAARRNLRTVVTRARELEGVSALEATDLALRWRVAVDVLAFEAAALAQRHADAVTLWVGSPLAGLDDPSNPAWTEWLEQTRSRLQAIWQAAAGTQLALTTEPTAAIELAERLLALDALDEPAMAARLRAELALHQPARARQLYARYAQRLADEWQIQPSLELQALRDQVMSEGAAQVRPGQATAEVARVLSQGPASATAMPAVDTFVGRRLELAELRALLGRPECRLLTLLGPGGVGKSRLARALAGLDLEPKAGVPPPNGPSPVWWLDLQELNQAAELWGRLARRLGILALQEQQALQQIAAAMPDGPALLVLDNAEHLPELAPMLQALLDLRPALQLLVTSRRRLRGPLAPHLGEWVFPVEGLAVPDADSRDPEAAASFDAVRLFVERAHAVQPGFEAHRHMDAVVSIAGAVGGMPLALELAAGWLRLMSPAAIAAELSSPLELLQRYPAEAGPAARPAHLSLRDVLQQSLQHLTAAERAALAAVSVFQDGFTREAARALGRVAALPLLSSLVDQSLLAVDGSGRFRLHPLVRACATSLLNEDPDTATAALNAHASHMAQQAAQLAPLTRGDLSNLLVAVDTDFANIAGAWAQLLAAGPSGHSRLAKLVRVWWVYFEVTGRPREGIARLRPALEPLEAAATQHPGSAWALSRLRHGLSMLLHRGGHQNEALAVAQAGVDAGLQGGDLEAFIGCLLNTGSCLLSLGRLDEAHARFAQALALARQHDDAHCVAWALGNLVVSHSARNETTEAISLSAQALAIDRARGNQYQVAVYLINLGVALDQDGQSEAARQCVREAVQHTKSHGLLQFTNYARSNLAGLLLRAGQVDEARLLMREALHDARAQGLLGVQTLQLTLLARVEARAGHLAQAQDALRQALALVRQHGMQMELSWVLRAWAALQQARGQALDAARTLCAAIALPATQPADALTYRRLLTELGLSDAELQQAEATVPGLDALLAAVEGPRAAA